MWGWEGIRGDCQGPTQGHSLATRNSSTSTRTSSISRKERHLKTRWGAQVYMYVYMCIHLFVSFKLFHLFLLSSDSFTSQRLHQTILLNMKSLQFTEISFPMHSSTTNLVDSLTIATASPRMTNHPERGAVRSRDLFTFYDAPIISPEQLRLQLSNFVHR